MLSNPRRDVSPLNSALLYRKKPRAWGRRRHMLAEKSAMCSLIAAASATAARRNGARWLVPIDIFDSATTVGLGTAVYDPRPEGKAEIRDRALILPKENPFRLWRRPGKGGFRDGSVGAAYSSSRRKQML